MILLTRYRSLLSLLLSCSTSARSILLLSRRGGVVARRRPRLFLSSSPPPLPKNYKPSRRRTPIIPVSATSFLPSAPLHLVRTTCNVSRWRNIPVVLTPMAMPRSAVRVRAVGRFRRADGGRKEREEWVCAFARCGPGGAGPGLLCC